MKTLRLKHKFLFLAALTSVMLALAYTTVASFVINHQNKARSTAELQHAAGVVNDAITARERGLLAAARELATQRDLGSTIWYLNQYARSGLDHDTLTNTYHQIANDAARTGIVAGASRVGVYDANGHLIAFARPWQNQWITGFYANAGPPAIQTSPPSAGSPRPHPSDTTAAPGMLDPGLSRHTTRIPLRETFVFTATDGFPGIEATVPVTGEAFDSGTGKPVFRQLGFVVLVAPLDHQFIQQLASMTNTAIDLFSAGKLVTGTVTDYLVPQREHMREHQTIHEIQVNGSGYYQLLIPLKNQYGLTGSIALLQSTALVSKNNWQMIGMLWLITGASLVFIFPLVWFFASSLARPITLLTAIFHDLAKGNALTGEELEQIDRNRLRQDELGDLTRSFMSMNDAVNQKIAQINELNTSLERKVAERTAALVAREQEARTVIENSPDSISRYDRDCRRVYANPALCDMTEGGANALLGKRPSESPGGANSELYEQKIRNVFASGQNDQFELRWQDRFGREICSHIRLTPEFNMAGNVVTVLGIGRDITERLEFEKTIWEQANFDMLTRLPNRQMFYNRLQQESRLAKRSGKSIALLLVDLDHFKEVNDTLGHDMGDMLLVEAAKRISHSVRATDTVARLGGDEFTIILSELDDTAIASRIAQNVIDKLASPFMLGAEKTYISASIGISFFPDDASELEVLFKNADQAMYAAKNSGRNRFSYFTQDMQEAAQMRLRLTSDLRSALAQDQFRVFYQPIVDLKSGRVHKAEALLRWLHPERGMLDPAGFIVLAEETGLIGAIGDWVFKQAVSQASIWRQQVPDFQISINKSPAQLHQEELLSWTDYLQQQGLDPAGIAIEITEGLLLNPDIEVNEKLIRLHQAGIQLAIDDFGTGYSSLSYIKRFDIDYIKIDQSYIKNLASNATDLSLCEAIIAMAHKLGIQVIAEGVETTAQRDLLLARECDYVQGYLFSQPVTAEVFSQQYLRA